jgi:hypothetical protein
LASVLLVTPADDREIILIIMAFNVLSTKTERAACVYRKLKLGRSGTALGSATASRRLRNFASSVTKQMASHAAICAGAFQQSYLLPAPLHDEDASRVKPAA